MAQDGKYGNVEIPGIPDDEPVFILRAQDEQAEQTIDFYGQLSAENERRQEFIDGVSGRLEEFRRWATENPEKVKLPD